MIRYARRVAVKKADVVKFRDADFKSKGFTMAKKPIQNASQQQIDDAEQQMNAVGSTFADASAEDRVHEMIIVAPTTHWGKASNAFQDLQFVMYQCWLWTQSGRKEVWANLEQLGSSL